MLNDRVTIITGGGRGLGKALTMAILAAGGPGAVTRQTGASHLHQTMAEAESIHGPARLLSLTADVTRPDDCERTIATTLKTFGQLDAVINNAGRGMRVVNETFNTTPVRFWEIDTPD